MAYWNIFSPVVWFINIYTLKKSCFSSQKSLLKIFNMVYVNLVRHEFCWFVYVILFVINQLQRKTNKTVFMLINHPYTKRLATDKKRRGVSLVLLETSKRSFNPWILNALSFLFGWLLKPRLRFPLSSSSWKRNVE